jgi:Ni,Fe-hydrogenase maturation factor
MTDKKTLILGLGNDILTDDGIGTLLVCDLSQMINDPNVQFDTASCGGLEIMEFSEEFTPKLREKYPAILEDVFALVKQVIG